MNYNLIKEFYGWGFLTPGIDWYRQNDFLTDDQYKELTGKDYTAPTTDTTTA